MGACLALQQEKGFGEKEVLDGNVRVALGDGGAG
jgi:hypothetical protein